MVFQLWFHVTVSRKIILWVPLNLSEYSLGSLCMRLVPLRLGQTISRIGIAQHICDIVILALVLTTYTTIWRSKNPSHALTWMLYNCQWKSTSRFSYYSLGFQCFVLCKNFGWNSLNFIDFFWGSLKFFLIQIIRTISSKFEKFLLKKHGW